MRRPTDPTLRKLAWAAFGASLVMLLGALPILMSTHPSASNTSFATGGAWADLVINAMVFSFPLVGIVIAHRQPRNRIGWLMLAFGLVGLLGSVADAYSRYGFIREPGSAPGAGVAATVDSSSGAPSCGAIAMPGFYYTARLRQGPGTDRSLPVTAGRLFYAYV